jgi:hypothetical protein
VTETTTEIAPPEASHETVGEGTKRASVGTPAALWILYALGIIAAVVLAASLIFVVLAYLTSGDSGFGLDVSTPALVLWLGLAITAGGTFVWRRYGSNR